MHLEEYEIKFLCLKARDIFINQPILLELEAPIKICGEFQVAQRDDEVAAYSHATHY